MSSQVWLFTTFSCVLPPNIKDVRRETTDKAVNRDIALFKEGAYGQETDRAVFSDQLRTIEGCERNTEFFINKFRRTPKSIICNEKAGKLFEYFDQNTKMYAAFCHFLKDAPYGKIGARVCFDAEIFQKKLFKLYLEAEGVCDLSEYPKAVQAYHDCMKVSEGQGEYSAIKKSEVFGKYLFTGKDPYNMPTILDGKRSIIKCASDKA